MRMPASTWLVLAALICVPAHAFDLQGHRGARGLEPENTLAAFERALAIGVTTLEMDAAITADGVVVISHDPALNPAITRDAQGNWLPARGPLIKSMTLAQLQAFDVGRINPSSAYGRQFPAQHARDGERVPTLAAVFARVNELGAHAVRFNIETKVFPMRAQDTLAPEPFVQTLLDAIRAAGMTSRVIIQSFDWRTLQLIRKLEPGIETMVLTVRNPNFDTLEDGAWTSGLLLKDFASVAHMVKSVGASVWAPAFQNLTADAVRSAHELGLKVIPWTVNETADADRLIDWGVDGIITDYPDRMHELLTRRGIAMPAPVTKR